MCMGPPRRYAERLRGSEMGFDALLLCTDADLAELDIKKGARLKIIGHAKRWATAELEKLGASESRIRSLLEAGT